MTHRVLIRTRREDGTVATFASRPMDLEQAQADARRHNGHGKLGLSAEVVTEEQYEAEFPKEGTA